jgi:hypothetical protein
VTTTSSKAREQSKLADAKATNQADIAKREAERQQAEARRAAEVAKARANAPTDVKQPKAPEVVIEKPKPKPSPCKCGCGALTVSAKARFLSGHDARLASRLVTAALAAEAELGRVPTADEADSIGWAHAELASFGWTHKLDVSRASRASKAERKARKATTPPRFTAEEATWVADELAELDIPEDAPAFAMRAAVLVKLAAQMPAPEVQEEEPAQAS